MTTAVLEPEAEVTSGVEIVKVTEHKAGSTVAKSFFVVEEPRYHRVNIEYGKDHAPLSIPMPYVGYTIDYHYGNARIRGMGFAQTEDIKNTQMAYIPPLPHISGNTSCVHSQFRAKNQDLSDIEIVNGAIAVWEGERFQTGYVTHHATPKTIHAYGTKKFYPFVASHFDDMPKMGQIDGKVWARMMQWWEKLDPEQVQEFHDNEQEFKLAIRG